MNPGIGQNGANFFQLSGDYHPAVANAANQWNTVCDSMVPYFNPFSSEPSSLQINMHLSPSPVANPCGPGVCGCTQLAVSSGGQILGGEVWAFENKQNGEDCGDYAQLIAHELGHVLGFTEATAICLGRIMYGTFPAPPADPGLGECFTANLSWYTAWESPDPCDWPDTNDQSCGNQMGGSPILLDLDHNGIRLAGTDDPVAFDIDADGKLESIGWTSRGTLDAFLWKDRNGNGTADDGSELFGTSTPLSSGGPALNGYVALAELDMIENGGNSDGHIDSADAVFADLKLWIDSDHDGVSDSDEIFSLAEMGISQIGTFYRRSVQIDQHGNLLRYLSQAKLRVGGRTGSIRTVDVFFVLAE
jgi:hypothetical protein